MVIKRSLANWRLLSSVVVGVLLASAIMAGTVIYFESLRDLALVGELSKHKAEDLDILVKATKGPTTQEEYALVRQLVEGEIGSLEMRKYADMIVLDQNLFEVDAKDIYGTRVLQTIIGGEVVYERE